MIKSIEELNFDKKMREFINNVEESFNELAKLEDDEITMLDWINENLEAIFEEGIVESLTNREKFLFVFGVLSSHLEAIFEEGIVESLTNREKFLFVFGVLSSQIENRLNN